MNKLIKDLFMGANDPIVLRTANDQSITVTYDVEKDEVRIKTQNFKSARFRENNVNYTKEIILR